MRPIKTLLVANRGEIARRIFRTCRQMGIGTVAVYSDPDRSAPFVAEADQAVALGGASPAESYLRPSAMVEAAARSGADAIHPGYGFLAESPAFARAVTEAGLTWVGPPAQAVETMGSKLASKELVAGLAIPTLPAVDLSGLEADAVAEAAAELGFPVMVKASAGGGGRGMRAVSGPDDLHEAVEGARREAAAAFGDEGVLLEPNLEAPRHVEVQIIADTHGNTVALFERECSIQRRHQKIIEEAPCLAIDAELRTEMSETALRVAREIGYVGAGTVEFLLAAGDLYFLEMNTRLQVEHPVTEAVTGLDLVRLQLMVAAGESLPPEALAPTMSGHAIEARLYAEDPDNDLLPVTGTLDRFRFPEVPGLRVDSGVEDGSVVSIHYDPLLAKVVAWAPTRPAAAALLAGALRRAEIHGMVTNRSLLVGILTHPDYLAGETDTGFLARHSPAELGRVDLDGEELRRMALAAALATQAGRREVAGVLSTVGSGWRNVASQLQTTTFATSTGPMSVGYRFEPRGGLTTDGFERAALVDCTPGRVGLETDGLLGWYRVHRRGDVVHVDGPQGYLRLLEQPRFPLSERDEDAAGSLHAPMPGTVIRLEVSEGDQVEEGQVLVVMEAMKMEHSLRSPHAGTVASLRAAEGQQVEADAVIVVVTEA